MGSPVKSSITIEPCNLCNVGLFTWTTWSDEDILDWYLSHGVLAQTVECKSCLGALNLQRNALAYGCGKMFRKYAKKKKTKCGWRSSARMGTWLGGTNFSPKKILGICVTILLLRPPRQHLFRREFSISSRAFQVWSSNIRRLFIDHLLRNSVKLGGSGKVIEIEEAMFCEEKNIDDESVEAKWVLGGFDRKNRKTFLTILPNHDVNTVLSGIIDNVKPGSVIFSDCCLAYFNSAPDEIRKSVSSHNLKFVSSGSPGYETIAKRRMIDVRHCIPQFGKYSRHFGGFLGEYLFKIKYSYSERVHYFFKAAADMCPPPR